MVLFPKERMPLPGDAVIIHWMEDETSTWLFGDSLNPTEATGFAEPMWLVLAGVIDPEYQGKIELVPQNGGRENYVWNPGHSLRSLLVLPCSIDSEKRKL